MYFFQYQYAYFFIIVFLLLPYLWAHWENQQNPHKEKRIAYQVFLNALAFLGLHAALFQVAIFSPTILDHSDAGFAAFLCIMIVASVIISVVAYKYIRKYNDNKYNIIRKIFSVMNTLFCGTITVNFAFYFAISYHSNMRVRAEDIATGCVFIAYLMIWGFALKKLVHNTLPQAEGAQ